MQINSLMKIRSNTKQKENQNRAKTQSKQEPEQKTQTKHWADNRDFTTYKETQGLCLNVIINGHQKIINEQRIYK